MVVTVRPARHNLQPYQPCADFEQGQVLDRFESAGLVVEVAEIIIHKADQRELIAHLFDADALAGKDDTEIDLLPIEANATARRHRGGSVMEGIIEVWQASVRTG